MNVPARKSGGELPLGFPALFDSGDFASGASFFMNLPRYGR